MKSIYSHIIYIFLVMGTLIGCRPHYPEIEYKGDPGKVEFDEIESNVPIRVAINDPLFESYTRGVGAFDNFSDGASGDDNWKDADIYVYAFYSPNRLSGSPKGTRYSERMNSSDDEKYFCLVDDTNNENIGHGKRARLSRDMTSFLQWTHNDMVYYNRAYPQYRYKFFAYYLDDAADMTMGPNRGQDYVSYDVCIDGTQDLMCACADTTASQIENLRSAGEKYLLNNIGELTYSTETGHRDLFPVFEMNHQLVLVKFFLKTDSVVNEDGTKDVDPEVKKGNVRVKNIMITSPYLGEFVVAAEDTSRLGVKFTNDIKKIYIPVRIQLDENGEPITDDYGRRITVSRKEKGEVVAGVAEGFSPIIPEAQEKEIGMGFLLPPADSYELELECCQLKVGENGKQVETDYYTSKYQLQIGDQPFKAGHKYEVCIKVYGQRDINIGLGNITWKDGGDIVVGEEESDV